MSRPRSLSKKLYLAAAAAGIGAAVPAADRADAAIFVNSFNASPLSIPEGSSVSAGYTLGTNNQFFVSVNSTIGWGDASSTPSSGTSGSASHAYADDGNYTVSLNGSGTDGYNYQVWVDDPWPSNGHYETRTAYSSNSFSASSSVQVTNVAPTVQSLTGDLTVNVGDAFGFGASASDPGVLDTLTYSWDFDSSNGLTYTDFNGATGSWSFAAPGNYQVSLRVTDGDGGSDVESFEVVAVPEPGTLSLLGVAGLALLRRRRV